jgi:hypothetical protein
MAYSLQMSDEMHGWLTDLRDSDPPAAAVVGEALAALMSAAGGLRPPLVIPLAQPLPADLGQALDRAYQDRLQRLTVLRRRVAEAAGQPESGEEVDRLREECRRLDARTQAFRTRKEILKAAYTTARLGLQIHETIVATAQLGEDGGSQQEDRDAIAAAAADLREATAEIEEELRREALPAGLMELRPGPPGDGEIRILFGLNPPGTALLIAALEGREAVREHHSEAVMLSAQVLREVRAGQAPEAAAYAYDDKRSFLDEFYPGKADEMDLGATALAARNRARTLAEQRVLLALTQTEVALRMGVRQERVSAIERAAPGATEVRTLASYVRALGGRLEITAEFPDERVPLR